jgi:hypothetical protein
MKEVKHGVRIQQECKCTCGDALLYTRGGVKCNILWAKCVDDIQTLLNANVKCAVMMQKMIEDVYGSKANIGIKKGIDSFKNEHRVKAMLKVSLARWSLQLSLH